MNPSVPGFGGPTGLGAARRLGDTVYSYGNSELRGGVTKLSPKQGVVVQGEGNGWSRSVYTVTPGVPGDSGSGFMDGTGKAIGVLSTLQLAPAAGSNGVGDLRHEIDGCTPTARSRECSWSTARSRLSPTWSARS